MKRDIIEEYRRAIERSGELYFADLRSRGRKTTMPDHTLSTAMQRRSERDNAAAEAALRGIEAIYKRPRAK